MVSSGPMEVACATRRARAQYTRMSLWIDAGNRWPISDNGAHIADALELRLAGLVIGHRIVLLVIPQRDSDAHASIVGDEVSAVRIAEELEGQHGRTVLVE